MQGHAFGEHGVAGQRQSTGLARQASPQGIVCPDCHLSLASACSESINVYFDPVIFVGGSCHRERLEGLHSSRSEGPDL